MTKILIVEDTATFRAILRHQLVGLGVTDIWMAADGGEALKMLQAESNFDAIICDWHMHPMDGLTFCGVVQSIPTTRERPIPVLFMTSDPKLADPEKRARMLEPARKLGIVEILPKPFDVPELKATLNRCIGAEVV